jgi:hypothetical protein
MRAVRLSGRQGGRAPGPNAPENQDRIWLKT